MKAQIEYYVDSVFFTVRDHALRTARDLDVAWIIATGNYVVAMVASDAESACRVCWVFVMPL